MTAPDLTARSYHSDHGGYSNKCSICQSPFYGGKGRVNCAICKTVGEELARLRFALVTAERERDAAVAALQVPGVWSPDEITAMAQAFDKAQLAHGFYETMMAVGAALLRERVKLLTPPTEARTDG